MTNIIAFPPVSGGGGAGTGDATLYKLNELK